MRPWQCPNLSGQSTSGSAEWSSGSCRCIWRSSTQGRQARQGIRRVSRTGGSGWDLSTGNLVGAVLKVVRYCDHLCFYLLFFESCDSFNFFTKMTGYTCSIVWSEKTNEPLWNFASQKKYVAAAHKYLTFTNSSEIYFFWEAHFQSGSLFFSI